MRIDSKLLAVDPYDCGCTECMVGEYVPLRNATDDHIEALLLGILHDNTSAHFDIAQSFGGGYRVKVDDREFKVHQIRFPITVEHYTLDLFPATVAENLHRFTRIPDGDGYKVI